MMTNHPTSDDLFAYRDGELDFDKRGLVEAHVLSCTACAARLDAMSDAEGSLRQEHPVPPQGYLEEMTASVMARVEPQARGARAAEAAGGTARARPGAGEPTSDASDGRSGRRRNFAEESGGRAPGLPWAAIVSTVSAAAAVLVVVALLFKAPEIWRQAPAPQVVGLPEDDRLQSKDPSASGGSAPDAAAPSEEMPAASPDTNALFRDKDGSAAAKVEQTREAGVKESAPKLGAVSPDAGAANRLDRAAKRDEEVTSQNAAEVVPPPALEKKAATEVEVMDLRTSRVSGRAAAPASGAEEGEGGFGPLAARYGLPTLYDPNRVSSDALLRAEPEIRTLYQTGHAGADSARVRLYLAEAARLRVGDSPDAETYDTIVHHYQRAGRLARDPETARMIRKRLEDFVSRAAPAR